MTSETSAGRIIAGAGVRPFEFTDHHCFACGSLNRHGLGLVLHVEPGFAWTQVTLERRFEGWDGIAHGGILCAILDEVMGWALVGGDNWGLTARLNVEFKAPVRIGQPFRGEGEVSRSRRRLVETRGRLIGEDGTLHASATATYVAADPTKRRELQERYGFRWRDDASASDAPDPVADPTGRPELVRS